MTRPAPLLPALPISLRWLGDPVEASVDTGLLQVTAGRKTDWFVDPGTGEANVHAPALVGGVEGDFMLAARVDVRFAATYDAGALVLWGDERRWAKLCLEYSPQQKPTILSVVTRAVSDDCNSTVCDGDGAWLRVARIGGAYAFHCSTDGRRWDFVRHFRLDGEGELEVGFEAQSPLGEGCAVTFSEIRFEAVTLGDLRSGE